MNWFNGTDATLKLKHLTIYEATVNMVTNAWGKIDKEGKKPHYRSGIGMTAAEVEKYIN
jgi:hypothetical protein